jgi:hypothetical protein
MRWKPVISIAIFITSKKRESRSPLVLSCRVGLYFGQEVVFHLDGVAHNSYAVITVVFICVYFYCIFCLPGAAEGDYERSDTAASSNPFKWS